MNFTKLKFWKREVKNSISESSIIERTEQEEIIVEKKQESKLVSCPECGGQGRIYAEEGESSPCGAIYWDDRDCDNCRGSGTIYE